MSITLYAVTYRRQRHIFLRFSRFTQSLSNSPTFPHFPGGWPPCMCYFPLKKAAKPQLHVVDEMLTDIRLAHHRLSAERDRNRHAMTRCCNQNGDERVADAAKAQVRTGAIFLRPCVSGMTVVAVGRVRQRMYPMISVGQYRCIGRRTGASCTGCVAVSIRQWQSSDARS